MYIVEERKNILVGMVGLLVIVIMGGSILRWIIFPTPPFICLPIYLKLFVIIVSLVGGWFGYELSKLKFGGNSLWVIELSPVTITLF